MSLPPDPAAALPSPGSSGSLAGDEREDEIGVRHTHLVTSRTR